MNAGGIRVILNDSGAETNSLTWGFEEEDLMDRKPLTSFYHPLVSLNNFLLSRILVCSAFNFI